jgi:hypothetical protein
MNIWRNISLNKLLKILMFRTVQGRTSHVPGTPTGSPYPVTCGEGDIHQGGVFGDGEGGGSGDEEMKREKR